MENPDVLKEVIDVQGGDYLVSTELFEFTLNGPHHVAADSDFASLTIVLDKGAGDLIRREGGSALGQYVFFVSALNFVLHKYRQLEKLILRSPAFLDEQTEGEKRLYFNLNGKRTLGEHLLVTKDQVLASHRLPGSRDVDFRKANIFIYSSDLHVGIADNYSDADLIIGLYGDSEEGFTIRLRFKINAFDSQLLRQLFGHIEYLITRYEANRDLSLDEISLLTQTDEDILDGFNRAAVVEYENFCTIAGLFEQAVDRTPAGIALRFGHKSYTYEELNLKANRLAWYLVENYGVTPGDRIGLVLNKSDFMVIAILAVLKTGAAYIPVDPKYPEDRIRTIILESGPKVLLIDSDYMMHFSDFDNPIFVVDFQLDTLHEDRANAGVKIAADDIAYIIYTSGSTGKPKGVMIENKSIVNTLLWRIAYYKFDASAITLQIPSYAFDSSVLDIFSVLLAGGILVVPDQSITSDVAYFKNIVQENKVNNFLIVPSFYRVVLKELGDQLATLQFVTVAGEAVNNQLVQAHFQHYPGARLFNEYGPTENAVCSSCAELLDNDTISIGRPISNVGIHIVDPFMRRVPVGCIGEICLSGAGLSRGYLNDGENTSSKFMDCPFKRGERLYKTGDLGRYQSDGSIIFLGRIDQQVKIRGYRIELSEIEGFLMEVEGIDDAIVLENKHDDQSSYLIGFVKTHNGLDEKEVKMKLGRNLPEYMIPSVFVTLDSFPVLPNGKIDTRSLVAKHRGNNDTHGTEPVTQTEKALSEIWREILSQGAISRQDDFFNLGGHSLHVTQLIARIDKVFHKKIDYDVVFEHSTLSDLSVQLDNYRVAAQEEKIPKAGQHEFYELSEQQQRFWLQSQVEENSMAHNMIKCYRMTGRLDVKMLNQAFRLLINRHESLRTGFQLVDGEPRQTIHAQEDVVFFIDPIDVESPDQVDRYIQEIKDLKFDLSSMPLMVVRLLRLSEEQHVLIFSMHHIIGDGWSLEIILRELFTLYEFDQNVSNSVWEPLTVQYRDFSEWQRSLVNSPAWHLSKAYWHNKLKDFDEVNTFPADLFNAKPSASGAIHSFALEKQTTLKLRNICDQHKVTMFHVMVSAIKILLYSFTGQKDISIGTPHSGRHHVDLEGIVGYFLEIFIIRDVLDENDPFVGLVEKVKKTVLDASQYRLYSLERIIDEMNVPRSDFGNAAFETGLSWQNYDDLSIHRHPDSFGEGLNEVKLEPIDAAKDIVKQSIWFFGTEKKFDVGFYIKFRTDLYSHSMINTIADAFKIVVRHVSEYPQASVKQINQLLNEKFHVPHFYNQVNEKIDDDF